MKTFQVTQNPAWACPQMLIFVDDDGNIIGQQTNPANALTQEWADDNDNWGHFDPDSFHSVAEV